MKSKQILSIKQMQHLKELGLDTSNASMYWISYNGINVSIPSNFHLPTSDNDYVICDAYTLQDVLDALPRFVIDKEGNKYYLQIEMMNTDFDDWRVSYKSVGQDESPLGYFQAFQLIDAAVRMLVLCYEKGYVETDKNE